MDLQSIASSILADATDIASLLRTEDMHRRKGNLKLAAEYAECADEAIERVRYAISELSGARG